MNLVEKAYNYITKKWIINFIISTLPGIWFLILSTLGKQFKFQNEDGILVGFPLYTFWVCIFITVIYNALSSWKKAKDKKEILEGTNLLSEIISYTNALCDKKVSLLNKYINTTIVNKNYLKNPFNYIIKPSDQIYKSIEELNILLARLLDMQREEIGISLVYKFDFNNKWNYYEKNVSNLDISKITKNPDSTFNMIINKNKDIIFFCNKQDAIFRKSYIAGNRDDKACGSIICINLCMEYESAKYIQAVLSITTYEKPLCSEQDNLMKERLTKTIIAPFKARIKLELCNKYILAKYKSQRNIKAG